MAEDYTPSEFDRVTSSVNPQSAFSRLRRHLGDRYGGRWMVASGKLAVGAVEATASDRQFLARLDGGLRYMDVHDVTWCLSELGTFAEAVKAELESHEALFKDIALEISPRTNSLVLHAQAITPELRDRLAASVPPGALQFTNQNRSKSALGTSPNGQGLGSIRGGRTRAPSK